MSLRKIISEVLEDAVFVDTDGQFDNAIIGLAEEYGDTKVVYDSEMIIKILQDKGCNYEQAREFTEFNTLFRHHIWPNNNRPIFVDILARIPVEEFNST